MTFVPVSPYGYKGHQLLRARGGEARYEASYMNQ